MSKVFPASIIIDTEPRVRRNAQILTKRKETTFGESINRFINIDVDIIKHDKWYKINLLLSFLSFILVMLIAYYFPPCESNKIPIWIDIIKYIIYGATGFVWLKTQIGIYEHHYPKQPILVPVV